MKLFSADRCSNYRQYNINTSPLFVVGHKKMYGQIDAVQFFKDYKGTASRTKYDSSLQVMKHKSECY